MFSGIIERKGKLVRKKEQGRQLTLTFEAKGWEKPLKRGESLSINGVCLSVSGWPKPKYFSVQAVKQTLENTNIGSLRLREHVNLERSLKWGERIGGHFVLGHVDGTGQVLKRLTRGKNITLMIEIPESIEQHLVPKGSIAVDGVSMTIQELTERSISIAIISLTAKSTTLGTKKPGDRVNLEADVIAKHLAKLVSSPRSYATEMI